MGKNLPSILPDTFLRYMDEKDRPKGKAGWTAEVTQDKNARREELAEQKEFYRWLNLNEILFYNPQSNKASTIRKGAPDFTVFHKSITLFIEFKAPGCKQTEEQVEFEQDATRAGFRYYLVYSAAEAIAICKEQFCR